LSIIFFQNLKLEGEPSMWQTFQNVLHSKLLQPWSTNHRGWSESAIAARSHGDRVQMDMSTSLH